jgi:serine phosphatase RsbU (regulator of sigma subunit)
MRLGACIGVNSGVILFGTRPLCLESTRVVECSESKPMPESAAGAHGYVEVVFTDRPRQVVPICEVPFFIGRTSESGNHLALDDPHISRRCVAIFAAASGLRIEDRGQRNGIFINGKQITEGKILCDGDRIRFGTESGCQLVFRSSADEEQATLERIVGPRTGDSQSDLNRLTLLLEATSLLHSQLPLEAIFATMLDHAIAITHADRGMLLEPDASGAMHVKVARGRRRKSLPPGTLNPSRTVLRQAVEQGTAVINEDLRVADPNVQTAQSVVLQYLRSAVVIPLYIMPSAGDVPRVPSHDELLGAIYLDSTREAAFSALDRQILDALGVEAASILDNARLMQRERERQRLEQELSIARGIQQALVPLGLQDYPHLAITGIHRPCHEVGGDYFDVFPSADGRTAILIADVAGKGLGAALLSTMLQGALSAMSLGADPVKVFEYLNRFLCDRAVACRHVTMFLGLIDPEGNMEFVRAGHPSPLLLRSGKACELYTEGSFPVGLVEEASFTASRIRLEPDDTLLLFTDGVIEAEDKDRKLFGHARLLDEFARYSNESLDSLQSGILGTVEKFSGGAKQSDDITLLLVRYRKPAGA